MAEIPITRGFIVCEQIIVDSKSKNVSLINCFSEWRVEHFPSDPQRFSIYAALTNGSGTCTMKVEIILLEDGSVIYERDVSLNFPDPLREIRFSFRLQQCIFPRPGKYNARLLADGDLIAEAVFRSYS